MKRVWNLTLALLLVFSLTACGGQEQPTPGPQDAEEVENDAANGGAESAKDIPSPKSGSQLVFVYRDCPLPMNAEFAPLLDFIGEPDSYFEAASCAFDGLDKTYTYGEIELITYPDEDVDYISSIRLLSDGAATPEGITIGSSLEDVVAAYGEDYTDFGGQYTYEDGDTRLSLLFQDDVVISVEYVALNDLLA